MAFKVPRGAQAYDHLKKILRAVNGAQCPPFPPCRLSACLNHGFWRNRMNTFASRFALLALAVSAVTLAPAVLAQSNTPANASSSQSSGPQHAAPDPQKQAARLTKRLALSNDQSTKITAILQNQQQQLATVRGDNSLSQQDRRAKMRSIHQDADTQINAVLTPAQQTQYASMKQQMRARMQNARNGGSSANNSDSDNH
jgi:periplasmic protein CpxP/Spy